MIKHIIISGKKFELAASFIHPITHKSMYFNSEQHLCDEKGEVLFPHHMQSYDFVVNASGERSFYDDEYEAGQNITNSGKDLSLTYLQEFWETEPCQRLLWDSLGDLNGKKILILGNGTSKKELLFLFSGAEVVYSDLSWGAIAAMKNYFITNIFFKNYLNRIEFHAVDAIHTPFSSDQFDVIYGYACAHHIKETEDFLREVYRCLKPGGICRFMDDGYSSLWQAMKSTVLKPLQLYSHSRKGISPEDLVATELGGFRPEQIYNWGKRLGFHEIYYQKISFFEYFLNRGTGKLGCKFLSFLIPFVRHIDTYLLNKTNFIKRQGIRLVWGYTKS